jgi:hypothetical protein
MRTGVVVLAVLAAGCDLVAAPRDLPKQPSVAAAPPVNLRYQVDAARDRVWLLTPEGVVLYDGSKPYKTEVLLPGWHWAGAPYGCLPGLAIGPKGEALVTSDVLPRVWQIDPESLEVTVRDLVLDADQSKDVGFSGLVYVPEQSAFFAVSSAHGSLWRIDAQLTRGHKVQLSEPITNACGVFERARSGHYRTAKPPRFCAGGPGKGWAIDLAPDQRSAFVNFIPGEGPCVTR